MKHSELAALKTAYETEGPRALIKAGTSHGPWGERLWCAAMTEYYGPLGVHESRKDAEGRPTAETLAEFPDVARRIEAARESIAGVWTFLNYPEHPWFRD